MTWEPKSGLLWHIRFVCVDVDLAPHPVHPYVQQMLVGWFLS